ncbi:carbohydrate kinase family protein [bacterium]|nr:carbohydrate kinase family protein [bacterium]
MNIVITGSIAFDYLMAFSGRFADHFLPDKLDRISVSFLVDSLRKRKGGCAANIAYNLALLGEHPMLVGLVGEDFDEYRSDLKRVGVDVKHIRKIEGEFTASFFGNTDQAGNQICSFYTGAMRHSSEISLSHIIKDQSILVSISPNDPGAMIQYVDECQKMNVPYIYDPGQQIVQLSGPSLKKGTEGSKMLIVNEYEYELFQKKVDLKDRDLLELTETIIITLGDQGSKIITREKTYGIPVSPPKRVIDPTGVGDGYRAGLIKGWVWGLPWDFVGRMGSLAATYVLETDGPQSHHYSLNDFIERYHQVFGESNALRRLIKT